MSLSEHTSELLPWMVEDFKQLIALKDAGKLAHAYLFGGQQGLGKLLLAKHFSHFLLCTNPQGNESCGECRECQLLAAGTHPDLKVIQPVDSKEIKIDQIRETINFFSQTSQRGGYKIIIIEPAESLNINSANALLKVLEEPTDNTLLILVSHQPALLMATIRSRCHIKKFNRPAVEISIDWLESKNVRTSAKELLRIANNIPLRALHFADEDALHDRTVLHSVLESLLLGKMNIAEAADQCESYSLEDNIEALMLCSSDILTHNQLGSENEQSPLHDHDLGSLAVFFQDSTKLKALHIFYQELLTARRTINRTSNPNRMLVLESLFYNWASIAR